MKNTDTDLVVDYRDHKLALVKDRSRRVTPGKFSARSKADRPQDKLAAIRAQRCDKFKITDPEIAKEIVAIARNKRAKALAEGRTPKRLEDRWYLCDTCTHGKTKIYHVSKLSAGAYAAKFEESKREDYSLAS